jgi:hypothetical protein
MNWRAMLLMSDMPRIKPPGPGEGNPVPVAKSRARP